MRRNATAGLVTHVRKHRVHANRGKLLGIGVKDPKRLVRERGFEPPTPWSRIQGAGTNFVATQSFEWCFNRLILAQSCHSGMNVSPRMAVPTRPNCYRVKICSTVTRIDIQRHWQQLCHCKGTLKNYCWTLIGPRCRHLSHATSRAFIALFRAVRGFFRNAAAGFRALGVALTEDGDSSLGCFAVRWWPWFRGWMRAVSFSIRS
jgi:hypothetical protein